MSWKVTVSFTEEQRRQVVKFAEEVDMKLAEFCKRAVFYAINDAYRRAEEVQKNGAHNTASAVAEGITSEAQSGPGPDTNALSNQADAPATP